jgi:hypothetical protein
MKFPRLSKPIAALSRTTAGRSRAIGLQIRAWSFSEKAHPKPASWTAFVQGIPCLAGRPISNALLPAKKPAWTEFTVNSAGAVFSGVASGANGRVGLVGIVRITRRLIAVAVAIVRIAVTGRRCKGTVNAGRVDAGGEKFFQ